MRSVGRFRFRRALRVAVSHVCKGDAGNALRPALLMHLRRTDPHAQSGQGAAESHADLGTARRPGYALVHLRRRPDELARPPFEDLPSAELIAASVLEIKKTCHSNQLASSPAPESH